MNATTSRLTSLTVKALREIADLMNVKILSRDRKAVIVQILTDHIEDAHVVALMTNETFAGYREQASVAKDMISEARKAIKALTPTLNATKRAFEEQRDAEFPSEIHTGIAYQIWIDTHRAIEEYTRSIAYIAGDHECMNSYSEIGLTDECNYGCKIYRCAKCQDETVLHNATYGCRQNS